MGYFLISRPCRAIYTEAFPTAAATSMSRCMWRQTNFLSRCIWGARNSMNQEKTHTRGGEKSRNDSAGVAELRTAGVSKTLHGAPRCRYFFFFFLNHHFFTFQPNSYLIGGFTLSDLMDKTWSQVSSLLPPRYLCLKIIQSKRRMTRRRHRLVENGIPGVHITGDHSK